MLLFQSKASTPGCTTQACSVAGRVKSVLRKVKPAEHDELVLAALDA